MILDLQ